MHRSFTRKLHRRLIHQRRSRLYHLLVQQLQQHLLSRHLPRRLSRTPQHRTQQAQRDRHWTACSGISCSRCSSLPPRFHQSRLRQLHQRTVIAELAPQFRRRQPAMDQAFHHRHPTVRVLFRTCAHLRLPHHQIRSAQPLRQRLQLLEARTRSRRWFRRWTSGSATARTVVFA